MFPELLWPYTPLDFVLTTKIPRVSSRSRRRGVRLDVDCRLSVPTHAHTHTHSLLLACLGYEGQSPLARRPNPQKFASVRRKAHTGEQDRSQLGRGLSDEPTHTRTHTHTHPRALSLSLSLSLSLFLSAGFWARGLPPLSLSFSTGLSSPHVSGALEHALTHTHTHTLSLSLSLPGIGAGQCPRAK